MSQSNLAAPPLNELIASQILNIEIEPDKVDPKTVLEVSKQNTLKSNKNITQRYYILFNKNDPKNGGTTYMQSKIHAAKECLMAQFPNAKQIQQEYYKQHIEPTLKPQNESIESKKQQKSDQKK